MVDKEKIIQLRRESGMSLQVCHEALKRSGGNLEEALAFLVEKNQALIHKKMERALGSSAVFSRVNKAKSAGILLVLGAETDFVTRNAEFALLAEEIMDVAIAAPMQSKEELLQATDAEGFSVEEMIGGKIALFGENIALLDFISLEGPLVTSYVHTGNRLASLLSLNQPSKGEDFEAFARNLAIQVAAMDPQAITREEIDPAFLAEERGRMQAAFEGEKKSVEIQERIMEGKMKKIFQEHVLLEQPYIKDEEMSCREYMMSVDPSVEVLAFRRFSC